MSKVYKSPLKYMQFQNSVLESGRTSSNTIDNIQTASSTAGFVLYHRNRSNDQSHQSINKKIPQLKDIVRNIEKTPGILHYQATIRDRKSKKQEHLQRQLKEAEDRVRKSMNQTTLNITIDFKSTGGSEIKIPVKAVTGAGNYKTEDNRVPHLRFPTQVESSMAYKNCFPNSNEKQQ